MNDQEFMDAMIASANPHHMATTPWGNLAKSVHKPPTPKARFVVAAKDCAASQPLSQGEKKSRDRLWAIIALLMLIGAIAG